MPLDEQVPGAAGRRRCRARTGPASAAITTAPTSGIAPATVSQGNVLIGSAASPALEPHQQQRADEQHRADEHGQRIRADEAGLQPAQPPRTFRRTVAASVLTSPSTPRLSKYTDSLVSHWPGRISTDSLIASPYRSLRAATVTEAAGRRGHRHLPPPVQWPRRSPTPTTTSASATDACHAADRRARPAGTPITRRRGSSASRSPEDQERARADRADRQHDHRAGHHRRGLVRVRLRRPSGARRRRS